MSQLSAAPIFGFASLEDDFALQGNLDDIFQQLHGHNAGLAIGIGDIEAGGYSSAAEMGTAFGADSRSSVPSAESPFGAQMSDRSRVLSAAGSPLPSSGLAAIREVKDVTAAPGRATVSFNPVATVPAAAPSNGVAAAPASAVVSAPEAPTVGGRGGRTVTAAAKAATKRAAKPASARAAAKHDDDDDDDEGDYSDDSGSDQYEDVKQEGGGRRGNRRLTEAEKLERRYEGRGYSASNASLYRLGGLGMLACPNMTTCAAHHHSLTVQPRAKSSARTKVPSAKEVLRRHATLVDE